MLCPQLNEILCPQLNEICGTDQPEGMPCPSPIKTMNEFCLVMTTTDQEAHAEALAAQIVAARLGACVQLQAIKSFYVWQGQPEAAQEWLLMVKTREPLYAELERFIRANHHYETPEVVCLPIMAGAADYLAWVRAQTTPPTEV